MGGVDRCCQYGLNLEVTADPLFGNRGQGGELESKRESVLLVLADGEVFEGEAVGARAPGGVTTGELVFNTVLSGYQEVVTDPSYAGQVVAFTCPHIGNYGVNPSDAEAGRPWCRGIVVRELSARPSSWRATGSLESFLVENRVPGISGIDTRRLTRHLREDGAMGCAFGTADESELRAAAAAEPGTTGQRLRHGGDHEGAIRAWDRAGSRCCLRLRRERDHAPVPGRARDRHGRASLVPRGQDARARP